MWCKRFGVLCALFAPNVKAHSLLKWPDPRNDRPNNKRLTGLPTESACGITIPAVDANDPEIAPGPLTIWIQEAIRLDGSPWRIELTSATSDVESCVLLDNIPHDLNAANPVYGEKSTWNDYFITVQIPDVDCGTAGCSIVMYNPVAEDAACSNTNGNTNGVAPTPACESVYYSCSKRLKFTGAVDRATFPTKGESCWNGQTDQAVIQAADGTAISWINPDDQTKSVPQSPNVYRRESAIWSNARLSMGFDDAKVDPITNELAGPAASSYPDFSQNGDKKTSPPPPVGLSALGIIILIVLILGLVAVLVLAHLKPEMIALAKFAGTRLFVVVILVIRAAEFLVAVVNMIVIGANLGAFNANLAYIMGATVFLCLYSLVPFSIAGLIVQLEAQKEAAEDAKDGESFFKKLDNFQRGNPGTIILLACDGLFCFLFIIAAGTSCFYFQNGSSAIAFCTFLLLALEMAMVVLKFAIFRAGKSGETATTQKTGDNSKPDDSKTEDDPPKLPTAAPAPSAEPLAPVGPTLRVAEFDYQADRPDELHFLEGDKIQVLNERTDGWAKGVLLDSEKDPKPEGMFPLNYTKPFSE